MKDQIRSEVLKILSGYCFNKVRPDEPKISIISPWIGDVKLEVEQLAHLNESWFNDVYQISSINLPFALLILKLDFGADIEIITLPPNEKNYGKGADSVKNLLDFLDEIGCNVYINQDLHSKLILSNDLAFLGSFNLTFSALWGREEIGTLIDDLDNLEILRAYASNLVMASKLYGYTAEARFHLRYKPTPNSEKLTRGWLLDELIREDKDLLTGSGRFTYACHEFLFYHFGTIHSYDVAKFVAGDIDTFYAKAMLKCLGSYHQRHFPLETLFGYQGQDEAGEMLKFLTRKLVRTKTPKIALEATPVSRVK